MAILEQDLLVARQAWGEGLIAVSKKYESEGITAPESVTNEQKQEINIEEKIEVTNKDAEITSEENFEENIVPEEKKDQDEKEYTSDSVFAKLNELKKED